MLKRHLLRAGGLGGFLLLLSLLILPSKTASADLLNIKLSDPLQPYTSIANIKISPDGQYALFTADFITEDAFELYSVPMDGSEAPTLLSSGLLPTGALVTAYHITPDNSRVVYTAFQDSGSILELYSVPITGGPITKLNPPITIPGGEVDGGGATISPDSSRVVFRVEWQIEGVYELFSVPVTGGTPVRLNADLPMNGTLGYFEITPDSSHVVYSAAQDTAWIFELYLVPLDGGERIKLNAPLVAGGYVSFWMLSPDSSHVVYIADQDVAGQREIFSVALTDPPAAPIKLNPPMGVNSDVFSRFIISPDGSRVVYLADHPIDEIYLFYSVPIGGGTAVKLTQVTHGTPIFPSGSNQAFEISPDSSRLVFRAVKWGTTELFSVPLTGGLVTKLNGPIVPVNGNVWDFQISPDGSRVVYLANQQVGTSSELYSVPTSGGPVAKLNSALPNLGSVASYKISDDSQKVVYRADQQVYNEYELFSVPLADGDITQLNPPLVNGGDVISYQISPNSNHVLYVADQETDSVRELFVTFEEMLPPGAAYQVFIPFVQK